jgi:hypothetical protein
MSTTDSTADGGAISAHGRAISAHGRAISAHGRAAAGHADATATDDTSTDDASTATDATATDAVPWCTTSIDPQDGEVLFKYLGSDLGPIIKAFHAADMHPDLFFNTLALLLKKNKKDGSEEIVLYDAFVAFLQSGGDRHPDLVGPIAKVLFDVFPDVAVETPFQLTLKLKSMLALCIAYPFILALPPTDAVCLRWRSDQLALLNKLGLDSSLTMPTLPCFEEDKDEVHMLIKKLWESACGTYNMVPWDPVDGFARLVQLCTRGCSCTETTASTLIVLMPHLSEPVCFQHLHTIISSIVKKDLNYNAVCRPLFWWCARFGSYLPAVWQSLGRLLPMVCKDTDNGDGNFKKFIITGAAAKDIRSVKGPPNFGLCTVIADKMFGWVFRSPDSGGGAAASGKRKAPTTDDGGVAAGGAAADGGGGAAADGGGGATVADDAAAIKKLRAKYNLKPTQLAPTFAHLAMMKDYHRPTAEEWAAGDKMCAAIHTAAAEAKEAKSDD